MSKTYKKPKTKQNKTRKLKKINCAPGSKDNTFSCYSNNNLFILKNTGMITIMIKLQQTTLTTFGYN